MDHTLVRYTPNAFEQLSFKLAQQALVEHWNYPKELLDCEFDPNFPQRGLVLDKKRGNIIKLNEFGHIKKSTHGTKPIDYKDQKKAYSGRFVDLAEENFLPVDTSFSFSVCCLFVQMVDLKDKGIIADNISYADIGQHAQDAVDLCHRNGSLKDEVAKKLDQYILQEPGTVKVLENFKALGKKILIITNSDFAYTEKLLDYCINPFLEHHKHWSELFCYTITSSKKPSFFLEGSDFLAVDLQKKVLQLASSPLPGGIYHGGRSSELQEALKLADDEILYFGDHIYGDILKLKKTCHWRTAMVLEEIGDEAIAFKKAYPMQELITDLMKDKVAMEEESYELKARGKDAQYDKLVQETKSLDSKISKSITEYNSYFHPFWGEIMRAGQEQSRLAYQVEKYACITLSKFSDFLEVSPLKYFRPARKQLPYERAE